MTFLGESEIVLLERSMLPQQILFSLNIFQEWRLYGNSSLTRTQISVTDSLNFSLLRSVQVIFLVMRTVLGHQKQSSQSVRKF